MRSVLILFLCLSAIVGAQEGTPVNMSISNPLTGYTNLFFYSGSDLSMPVAPRASNLRPPSPDPIRR